MKKAPAMYMGVVKVLGEFLFLYGLLGWIYGVLVQLTRPEWLPLPLSHLTLWIRVDTFAMLSFVISAFGFLVLETSQRIIGKV